MTDSDRAYADRVMPCWTLARPGRTQAPTETRTVTPPLSKSLTGMAAAAGRGRAASRTVTVPVPVMVRAEPTLCHGQRAACHGPA